VQLRNGTNKYRVRIRTDNTEKYLGLFESFFEACCVRKSAENKYGFHENHGKTLC